MTWAGLGLGAVGLSRFESKKAGIGTGAFREPVLAPRLINKKGVLMSSKLFSPLQQRSLTLKNRIVMPPMAQYSAKDGVANHWHLAHYSKMAQGGVGTIIVESTSISFQGHGTYGDLGIWNDDQSEALSQIVKAIESFGAVPGVQLGHAGRKAALQRAFDGYGFLSDADKAKGEGPWEVVGPSAQPFTEGALMPLELSDEQIETILMDWEGAARRALKAGFKIIEIHAAHGYLLNQFLSPLANHRNDKWGGDAERRMAFPLEVVRRVRAVWPENLPLWIRVSAVDDADGGRTIEDTIEFARRVKARGVDAIHNSTGGWDQPAKDRLVLVPGYQVPFAAAVRAKADVATVAVGLITDAQQAEDIIASGQADLVAVGRELLVDPNWAHKARAKLEGTGYGEWPAQYGWWLEKRQPVMDALATDATA